MSKTTLNLRIDSQLKKQADSIIEDLGLSMSSSIVLFLKAVVREKAIPFEIKLKEAKKAAPSKTHSRKQKATSNTKDLSGAASTDIDSIRAAIEKL